MKAYIDLHPGCETWEDRRAWQGCPTVAVTRGGRVFAGWYTGGMTEPCIDNYNILVLSNDGGETWSRPILAIYPDRENRVRNIDIQLWLDEKGQLWVMWTHSPYPEGARSASIRNPFELDYHDDFPCTELLLCRNPDAVELRWEEPRVICGGFLRCKPIRTSDGRYVFPAYDWKDSDRYLLRVSDDGGETFRDMETATKPQKRVFDETMVFETAGGGLRILSRTNLGYYATAFSPDGGSTWGETEAYEPAPSTRMFIGRLQSGRLAYVRNISNETRTGMRICLSEDDGKTWQASLVLDDRENVSYPDLAQDGDGRIYVIHDRERTNQLKLDRNTWHSDAAKEILLSRITEEDILRGRIGEGSYLSRVISRGGIDFVEK